MRKTLKWNWRVVVYPRNPGDFGIAHIGGIRYDENEEEKICEEIARQIKRHVDKFEYDRGDVFVTFDREDVCEYCGYKWETDNPNYNDGCCSKNEEDFIKYSEVKV